MDSNKSQGQTPSCPRAHVPKPTRPPEEGYIGLSRGDSDPHLDRATVPESAKGRSTREDVDKPELSYLLEFPVACNGVVNCMMNGAKKYDRGSWKLGPKMGYGEEQIIDSLLRHLMARKNGEVFDTDSGLDHYKHLATNAFMLVELYGQPSAPVNKYPGTLDSEVDGD